MCGPTKTPAKTEHVLASVSIEVVDQTGSGCDAPGDIESWVQAAMDAADGIPDRPLEIAVLLVDEPAIQALNRDYRDKDKPTNVLSFPGGDVEGLPDGEPLTLGDIVICPAVLDAEAFEQGKPVGHHWAHLCIHGALHLAGYDHTDDSEASVMEALETALLAELGIPDPYSVQDGASAPLN